MTKTTASAETTAKIIPVGVAIHQRHDENNKIETTYSTLLIQQQQQVSIGHVVAFVPPTTANLPSAALHKTKVVGNCCFGHILALQYHTHTRQYTATCSLYYNHTCLSGTKLQCRPASILVAAPLCLQHIPVTDILPLRILLQSKWQVHTTASLEPKLVHHTTTQGWYLKRTPYGVLRHNNNDRVHTDPPVSYYSYLDNNNNNNNTTTTLPPIVKDFYWKDIYPFTPTTPLPQHLPWNPFVSMDDDDDDNTKDDNTNNDDNDDDTLVASNRKQPLKRRHTKRQPAQHTKRRKKGAQQQQQPKPVTQPTTNMTCVYTQNGVHYTATLSQLLTVGDTIWTRAGQLGQVLAISYTTNTSQIQLQLRLFHHVHDFWKLPDVQELVQHYDLSSTTNNEYVEVDEYVAMFTLDQVVPRPVRVSSRRSTNKSTIYHCRYMYRCNLLQLEAVDDWNENNGPLLRGLWCPKGAPGQIPALRRAYAKALGIALTPPPPPVLCANTNRQTTQWTQIRAQELLWSTSQTDFFASVQLVHEEHKRCLQEWTLEAGDFCLVRVKEPRVAQILCIYQNKTAENETVTQLEVRWCVQSHADLFLGPNEVWESTETEDGIPARAIVEPVHMRLGFFESPVKRFPGITTYYHCRFLYRHNHVQPLWSNNHTVQGWWLECRARAWQCSKWIRGNAPLAKSLDFRFGRKRSNVMDWFQTKVGESKETPNDTVVFECKIEPGLRRQFLLKTSLQPLWEYYDSMDLLIPKPDRSKLFWTVCVGDIVAVKHDQGASQKLYPFTVPWKAAQVLAIYKDDGEDSTEDNTKMEVRWFHRDCELNQDPPNASVGMLYEAVAGRQAVVDVVSSSRMLAPVSMFASSRMSQIHATDREQLWAYAPQFLPVTLYLYGGVYDSNANMEKARPSVVKTRVAGLFDRGIAKSRVYPAGASIRDAFLDEASRRNDQSFALQPHLQCFVEIGSNAVMAETDDEQSRMSAVASTTSNPPFHVDESSDTEYYHAVNLKPRGEVVDSILKDDLERIQSLKEEDEVWRIALGDVLLLQYPHRFGNTAFGPFEGQNQCYPLDVPWAIAEVVAIMRKRSNDVWNIEARWFYRAAELPGRGQATRKAKYGSDGKMLCEVIFESDHYDKISLSNILTPAKVVGHGCSSQKIYHLGMPVPQFTCTKFYSSRRKGMVPVAGMEGRIERGRSQSSHLARGLPAREALDSLEICADDHELSVVEDDPAPFPETEVPETDWKTCYRKVIQKLSLTDASKDGFENTDYLVGREKERERLESFFRGSIAGRTGQGDKPALFVAGPPGVGKTACIRAVVRKLQRESQRAKHKIPSFNFVALNGMEMREPFEAYVKLWEAVGDSHGKCGPDASAQNLERFFTGPRTDGRGSGTITVVLLDEIDYLVTPKQTVLYNLFDWPTRSLEVESKNRLVVVGVSNTLNLRDKLLPRVQSRIGSREIFFQAYSKNQIIDILNFKISKASPSRSVFDKEAVKFASMKAASQSGDIRKGLLLCRRAAEIVLERNEETASVDESLLVCVKDVVECCQELSNTSTARRLSKCTPYEALLIVAITSLQRTTGREEGGFDMAEVQMKMDFIANALGDPRYTHPPSLSETLTMLSRLGSEGLVTLETPRDSSISFRTSVAGCGGPWPLISMQADRSSVLTALSRSSHGALAKKFLAFRSTFG